jgi:biopolymer transport protein ExbB
MEILKENVVDLFHQGGFVMWPLLAVSVAALSVVIERFLLMSSCPFPGRKFARLVQETLKSGDVRPLAAYMERAQLLREYAAVLADTGHPRREAALQLAGAAVVARMERRLPLLGLLARIAPLLGLLGTILGMIATFSRIASAQSGVDMNLLSGGIWQALLTTAAGLCIAIPVQLCLHLLRGRARRVARALADAGNAALAVGPGTHDA